jgi:hypothetical protein
VSRACADDPAFDAQEYRRALVRLLMTAFAAAAVLMLLSSLLQLVPARYLTHVEGIVSLNKPGVISAGGIAFGVLAVGGTALGVIAIGGVALGVLAIGGGAVGVLAIGGGAVGVIAIGGGAVGVFALSGGGRGANVLSYVRHDRTSAEFFVSFVPGLAKAFPLGISALPGPPEQRQA